MGIQRRSLSLLLMAALLSASLSLAGTTADLRGRITDKDKDPLPGATVILRNDGLAVGEQGTVTDANGEYRCSGLPPGTGYRVRASLATYASIEFTEIHLSAGQVYRLDLVLRPASEIQERVRVRGHLDVVNTESVATSTRFPSKFIAGVPVYGQEYQDVLTLAPGVTDVNDTGNPNIHGARDTNVQTLVDGINTTDPLTGYFGQFLNIDSIEEIEVITAGASAEYSRAQGGFVNIVTKSGGNEFKGLFKLFVRSDRLDGDGAGIDAPALRGGLGEAGGLRQLSFTDLLPFLSLSGPIVKNRVWYFLANEFIQIETPVNAVNQAFVTRTRGYREFGKLTWQMNPDHRLALSISVDRSKDENQGLDSFSHPETGYSFERGGPAYTLKETAVLGPNTLLESSVSWFDNSFQRTPTLDPDTNGNGVLFVDDRPELGGNRDGFLQARERDPGEDYDQDGAYDIWEDLNEDGFPDGCIVLGFGQWICEEDSENRDGDNRLTTRHGCEGYDHEDANCNGTLEQEFDRNGNGVVDPEEDAGIPCDIVGLCRDGVVPGTQGNGRLDTEDRNGNGQLDVVGTSGLTPFPFWQDRNGNGRPDRGEFLSPLPPDRDYTRNRLEGGRRSDTDPTQVLLNEGGRITGPNPFEFEDHRKRFTAREDFSYFTNRFLGSHDLKVGTVFEHEAFDRTTHLRLIRDILGRVNVVRRARGQAFAVPATVLAAYLPTVPTVGNEAVVDNFGLYLQDTYKPLPNLTVGLGLRFDVESVKSSGFTFFEPASQALSFEALSNVRGLDADEFDNIAPLSLESDPIYGVGHIRVTKLSSDLASLAFQRLTRHEFETDISSPFLGTLAGGQIGQGITQWPREPEDFRITNSNLAPRLSVAWDPWNDGRSKGFVSWSRFYDRLFLNTVTLEKGLDTVTRYYYYNSFSVDKVGRPNNKVGGQLSAAPPSAWQVQRDLRTPFTDELTVGFERELAPELSLSVTYIRRDYRDQLQNIDVNHHTKVDSETGQLVDRIGTQVSIGDAPFRQDPPPGIEVERRLPDGRPDLYIHNFLFNCISRLGNFNRQTYRGLEIEFVRRLSRKWQMQGSYTYSRSQGDAESFLSVVGDDPALTEFESGFLDFDQTHVLKFNAVAYLPGDWQIGATAQWSSGLPYSVVDEFFAMDDIGYVQARRRFGQPDFDGTFLAENRNDHRNNAVYDFNARLQKNFVVGKATASGFFEIYNILNSDDLRIFTTNPTLNSFQSDQVRRFGRRFQVGFQVHF